MSSLYKLELVKKLNKMTNQKKKQQFDFPIVEKQVNKNLVHQYKFEEDIVSFSTAKSVTLNLQTEIVTNQPSKATK